jgi:hypothetical protein
VWNPVQPMEHATACGDVSIRMWHVSRDKGCGYVVAKLVWGSNLRILYAEGLVYRDAIGLGPIDERLLVQRGTVDNNLSSERIESAH